MAVWFSRASSPAPFLRVPQALSGDHEITITEYDLERVAVLFGAAKSLGTVFNPQQDALLTRVFDEHLRGTLADLRARLTRETDDSMRQSHMLLVRARRDRASAACCVRACVRARGRPPFRPTYDFVVDRCCVAATAADLVESWHAPSG